MFVCRVADPMVHDTYTIVNQDEVVNLHNIRCLCHQAIIEVPPSINISDVDTFMLFPISIVEMDAMLGCVNLIVRPSVGDVAGTSTGDQPSLSAPSHHIVVKDWFGCTLDVNATVELHAEGEVLEVGNGLAHSDKIPNNPCASTLVKNS